MQVASATFVKSCLDPRQFPRDRLPEIAFVGRSNVGKSTALNALLRRKKLAMVSKTPGKTRTINFFLVNKRFYVVDLPGYGYAKVPKTMKEQWMQVLTSYLRERPPLRLVGALVDARHAPTAHDQQMLALLEEAEVPTLILATKFDKLKASERQPNLRRIHQVLDLLEDAAVVPFSGTTGAGVQEVWSIVDDVLA